MLPYRVRKRTIHLGEQATVTFPAPAVIRIHFLPEQPFGDSPEGGRTVVRAVGTLINFDFTTGRHLARSALDPLHVDVETAQGDSVSLRGRTLEVRQLVGSAMDLAQTINSLYFAFPWLLCVSFVDPPWVERIDGELGGVPFEWRLRSWRVHFETTTQEEQEDAVAEAWKRLDLLSPAHRRPLLAALHYFHVACRLERESQAPGEFMAETLLNLAKVVQVLFPGPDGQSIEAARAGLALLGYSEAEVEARFVPVLALRNELDVAHVQMADLDAGQLTTIHGFIELVEPHFRELLRRVLDRILTGEWDVAPYEDRGPSASATRVVERMAEAIANDSLALPEATIRRSAV